MVAPTSQKAGVRPISFLLSDSQTGESKSISLIIRPEDLTRSEPSRAAVQQTLGGAWLDNFGPGLSSINIAGHTGWRGGQSGDGASQFLMLRDTVFTQWHARRAAAIEAGNDPSGIKLVFADSLDAIAVSVAPMLFVLKRNRARPLLMMYQMNLLVLGDDVSPPSSESSPSADTFSLGTDSLTDSLDTLQRAAANVRNVFSADIAGPIESFLTTANGVTATALTAVNSVNGLIVGQTAQVLGLAGDIAQAGRNAMYTYNVLTSEPDFMRASVMSMAGAFDNIACVIRNVFGPTSLFPNYDDVYGSSNCSSTSGGAPLSAWRNGNAFENVFPQAQPSIAVSPDAQTSIARLGASDPVLAPMTITELKSRLNSIGAGVVFP